VVYGTGLHGILICITNDYISLQFHSFVPCCCVVDRTICANAIGINGIRSLSPADIAYRRAYIRDDSFCHTVRALPAIMTTPPQSSSTPSPPSSLSTSMLPTLAVPLMYMPSPLSTGTGSSSLSLSRDNNNQLTIGAYLPIEPLSPLSIIQDDGTVRGYYLKAEPRDPRRAELWSSRGPHLFSSHCECRDKIRIRIDKYMLRGYHIQSGGNPNQHKYNHMIL
jgi:hypothetical protein